MSQQSKRQIARRDARTVASQRRASLLQRGKRLEDLAVEAMTALTERDAAVAAAELKAGEAIRQMTNVEGLNVREAVEWCGGRLSLREATRLRDLVATAGRKQSAT